MNDAGFLYTLATAIFIGGVCGYLGSLMVAKRMSLVGDAFGHIALPGIALAMVFNFNLSLGALGFLLAGIILIWFLKSMSLLHFETLTGIVFTSALAVSFLLIPHSRLEEALVGNISNIGRNELLIAAAASLLVFFAIRMVYKNLVLAALSEDLAKTEGIRVRRNELVFLLALGAVVALGIKIVGGLLVGALVIIPAAAARHLANNLHSYSCGAAGIGILSAVLGVFLSAVLGLESGVLIILSSAFLFFLVLLVKKIPNE